MKQAYMFKLTSGEVIFALVVGENDDYYEIQKPLVMGQQGNQIIFAPWLPVNENPIKLYKESVMLEPVPIDDCLQTLRQELSKIFYGIELATTVPENNANIIAAPFGKKK